MIRVYIAGPLGTGDTLPRVMAAIGAAEEVAQLGMAPFVPHLSVAWDHLHRHPYEWWMAYDLEWLKQCQTLLRIPGESPGADREVAWCRQNGIPVFFTVEELKEWASERAPAESFR